jgi:hypothetical protein
MKNKLVAAAILAVLLAVSLACIGCPLADEGGSISITFPEGGPKVGQTLGVQAEEEYVDPKWYKADSKDGEWILIPSYGNSFSPLPLTADLEGKYIKAEARIRRTASTVSDSVGPVKPAD